MNDDHIQREQFFARNNAHQQAIATAKEYNKKMGETKTITYRLDKNTVLLLPADTDVNEFIPRYRAKLEESHNKYQ